MHIDDREVTLDNANKTYMKQECLSTEGNHMERTGRSMLID
jgi:hypothetical protein